MSIACASRVPSTACSPPKPMPSRIQERGPTNPTITVILPNVSSPTVVYAQYLSNNLNSSAACLPSFGVSSTHEFKPQEVTTRQATIRVPPTRCRLATDLRRLLLSRVLQRTDRDSARLRFSGLPRTKSHIRFRQPLPQKYTAKPVRSHTTRQAQIFSRISAALMAARAQEVHPRG